MKKYIIILTIVVVLGGVAWYLFTQSNNPTSSYTKKGTKDFSQKQDSNPSTSDIIQSSSQDTNKQTPTADVSATFNIGNGSPDPKTVSARKSQRVALTFTNSNINDQVLIEGYDVNTYIIPLSESTIEFTVDKSGSFSITLAKKKTTIGTLKIN